MLLGDVKRVGPDPTWCSQVTHRYPGHWPATSIVAAFSAISGKSIGRRKFPCRGGYLLTLVTALAAGAWICLAEPAKIFRAVFDYNDDEIAE